MPRFFVIPPQVANYRGIVVIDLSPYLDGDLLELLRFQSLPQIGQPETVTFIAAGNGGLALLPSGRRQAIAIQMEWWTLPILLTLEVETVSGTGYLFSTAPVPPGLTGLFIVNSSLVGGPDVLGAGH